jgi:hypothetical protein
MCLGVEGVGRCKVLRGGERERDRDYVIPRGVG